MPTYTPEQITQVLNEYFASRTEREYIGMRYVPVFGRHGESSIEWDGGTGAYEPLTVVLHEGNSYTSRQYVPIGVDISNTDYWAETGNFNAQVGSINIELAKKLNAPVESGTVGQILTLGTSGTQWSDAGTPTDEQVDSAVSDWLDDHPEATTTVQDGSITNAKLVQTGGVLSEVEDIRTGYDGTVYTSAGNAVREQVETLSDVLGGYVVVTPGTPLTPTTYTNRYIAVAGDIINQNNADFKVSSVPVVAYTQYKIQGTTRLQAEYPLVAFSTLVPDVGNSGTPIINGSTTNTTYNETYTPTQDGYLWIASYSTREILSVTPISSQLVFENAPVRKALKMQLFGDSITDNTWGDLKTWVNVIQSKMPLYDLTIVNSAIGGTRLSKSSSTTNAVENLIEDGTTVINDADLIVIWAGTNDWASGGPELGTFLGSYGIYGAVKNIIQTLSTNVPNTMILFITPLQRYNATDQSRETDQYGTPLNTRNYTLRQFCDAIIETCEYFGIPCLDMNGTSGINRINVSTFTTDGLHPNDNGDTRLATIIGKKIDSLFGYCQ